MSVRQELVEALKCAPDEISDFWYTADEFKALGFSDALIAAMKDTTKNARLAHSYGANSSSRPLVQGANLA